MEAAQAIWIVPADGLEPVGWPGVVGAWVSPPPPPPSPGTRSRRTWSKLKVKVFAAVSPIWIRPTGVVPVSATQSVTIS